MKTALVVGSGPTGVHVAQTLLSRGNSVTMLDVGNERPLAPLPEADFDALKDVHQDPVRYFLGSRGEAIVFPTKQQQYYAFPPSKEYIFSRHSGFVFESSSFDPLISFAAGGLAEAWTGGSYPLNDAELADFPLDFATLEPHYAEVVRRVGVSARQDDLARFSPWFAGYMEPLPTDPLATHLLGRYQKRRSLLNQGLGFYLGRSRVALLTRDLGDRHACDNLGRCLWGCPRQSLYAPSSTLRQLRLHPEFRYLPGRFVTHFQYEGERIRRICAVGEDGAEQSFTADVYALAAGALCTSKIVLDSIYRQSGHVHELTGLMDNRQIMMPFVSLGMLGKPVDTHAYQFHQLALGMATPKPEEYVHGQITALKSASVHPIIQSLPLDLASASAVFRLAHAALGVANLWLHDRRKATNIVTLRPRPGDPGTDLIVNYAADDAAVVASVIGRAKRALLKLGCILPPGMLKVLRSGASVHYAGTIPMGRQGRFTCDAECRSNDFHNLYFADGVTFPFLPAKNLTFTLMANAIRVGEAMNRELQA